MPGSQILRPPAWYVKVGTKYARFTNRGQYYQLVTGKTKATAFRTKELARDACRSAKVEEYTFERGSLLK